MKKNLRSKILLCVLAGGVLAANTALAAEYKEYTESISSGNENYSTEIKSSDANGNYTYNFGQEAKLVINNESRGISLDYNENSTANKIIINDKLDISVTNKNNANATHGIYLQGNGDKEIDRSNGGNINVLVDDSELNAFAMGSGVFLTALSDSDNNVIKIGNAEIDVQVLNAKYGVEAYGLNSGGTGDNNKIIMGNGSINITANSVSEDSSGLDSVAASGIAAYNNTEIKTGNVAIVVTATGNGNILETIANGIAAEAGDAKVTTLNGSVTATAINTADGETYANAILAGDGSNVTKFDGNITAVAEGEGTLAARGVNLWSDETVTNLGVVDISAKTIGGSTENGNRIDSIGVWTRDGSTANIAGGSITAEAYNSDEVTVNNDANIYAILSDGTSFVNVNQGTNNDVVINGNIETRSDSTVKLNLNTINSELNGAIDDNSDNGTTLTLANGAEWNNSDRSNVTNVSMNGGIINQNTDKYIEIENYSGSGEIVLAVGDSTSNGDIDVITGRTYITSADEGSVINMSVNNNNFIGTTDSAQALANLNKIANEISYDDNNGHITGKVTIKEGLIMPEVSGDLLFDSNNRNRGYVANVKQNSSTTTIDNIKNIAATAIVAWRQEDSTLSQRLGELRESDGGQGIWVRMSRGEFEYDGEYKNQYNFFQMGYDWAAGNWHYGAAVSHNDGQTTYTHGDGENRSTSLSLYGTWLGDKGHYADIVLKQGRLSNDFDIYTEAGHTSGDYDAWGTSLSGEYGMKVDLDGGWYVTPQAQLTLMRIGGEDYTTNNGIKVNQDSLESAVGRVGFEVGKRISDSGSIYAKASLLHDFAGSADTYLSLNGLTNSYHQDIGDTWCEAGIGFNYKTSENSYLYADVVKTFGGDVETPWQWNAGMRWTF